MLVSLRGPTGWSLFALIWTLAVAGVVFKLFYTGRFERTSTLLYLGMGWIAVLAAAPMMRALSTASLIWLLAGGLAYTLGTVRSDERRVGKECVSTCRSRWSP